MIEKLFEYRVKKFNTEKRILFLIRVWVNLYYFFTTYIFCVLRRHKAHRVLIPHSAVLFSVNLHCFFIESTN